MAKKYELRQALTAAVDELEKMAGKSVEEGFSQELFDALEEKIEDLKIRLARVDAAEKIASSLAQPVPGQDRMTPRAPARAHKLYSSLKNFKDREIDGQMVRAVDQAYTVGHWTKATIFDHAESKEWCKSHGIVISKAQGEGTDSAGGYLVPEELMNSIITLREQYGVFRRECQVVPMGSDTLNWPRRVGGLTAFFTGENQAVQESQLAWDNVNLTAKKLGALSKMSNEISEDAIVNIGDLIVGEMAYAFALKEDQCGFTGDGSSTYGGIRGLTFLAVDGKHNSSKYTAATGHNTFATITLVDLTGLMGTLPQYAIGNAKWYMSQQGFYQMIANIATAAGGNRLDIFSEPIAPRFLGFPVVFSQVLPVIPTTQTGAAMFFFGDLSMAALLGDRRGITVKRSEHAYFANDQVALLATERFDINIHDFGDQGSAGPLVAMVAP